MIYDRLDGLFGLWWEHLHFAAVASFGILRSIEDVQKNLRILSSILLPFCPSLIPLNNMIYLIGSNMNS